METEQELEVLQLVFRGIPGPIAMAVSREPDALKVFEEGINQLGKQYIDASDSTSKEKREFYSRANVLACHLFANVKKRMEGSTFYRITTGS